MGEVAEVTLQDETPTDRGAEPVARAGPADGATASDHEVAADAGRTEDAGPSVRSAGVLARVRWDAVAIVATVATASVAWVRLFADLRGPLTCVVGAVLASSLAALGRRAKLVASAAASVAALVVVAAATTVPLAGVGLPTPGAVATVVRWFPSMVGNTLERGLPADSHGAPLLLALTATWLASATATSLVVRSRARAAALAPPIALWVLALLLGSPRPTSPITLTAPVILAASVFLAVSGGTIGWSGEAGAVGRRTDARAWSWTSSLTRRLAGLAIVLAAAVALAGTLPTRGGGPPSLQRTPTFDPREVITPLAQVYPQISAERPRELFVVRGAERGVDRITLAVLDHFDGETWQSTGTFRPVGETAPPDPRPRAATDRHRLEIEVRDLEGPWLPHVGRVGRIRLRDMQSDGADRNHVLPGGTRRAASYEVESTTVVPGELQGLVTADAGAALDPAWTQLPARRELGDELESLGGLRACRVSDITEQALRWADGVTASGEGLDDALAKVTEIERRLRAEHARNEEGSEYGPGHSLSDLCRVLGVGPAGAPTPAAEEQFASLMATMVRGLGVPARVAVGYHLPAPGRDGRRIVTEHHATAWTEVHLGAAGWVPFDPTPASEQPQEDRTRAVTDSSPSPIPPAAPTTSPPEEPPSTTVPATTVPEESTPTTDVVGTVVVGGTGLLAVLVLGSLVAIVLYKQQRRRRRRNAPIPNDAVAGAWLEAVDHLRDRGFPPAPELTEQEVAAAAERFVEAPEARRPLQALARLLGRARYSQQPVTASVVDDAWRLLEEVEATTSPGWRTKLASRFSLRSLRRPT